MREGLGKTCLWHPVRNLHAGAAFSGTSRRDGRLIYYHLHGAVQRNQISAPSYEYTVSRSLGGANSNLQITRANQKATTNQGK